MEKWVCDGRVQCEPYAEDEDIEECKHKFPETATFKCIEARNGSSQNITIYATPCDGITECVSRLDEENCDIPLRYLIYACLLGYLAIFITTFLVEKYCLVIKIPQPHDSQGEEGIEMTIPNGEGASHPDLHFVKEAISNEETFKRWHNSEDKKLHLLYFQGSMDRRNDNEKLVKMETDFHNGNRQEALCCIKVSST